MAFDIGNQFALRSLLAFSDQDAQDAVTSDQENNQPSMDQDAVTPVTSDQENNQPSMDQDGQDAVTPKPRGGRSGFHVFKNRMLVASGTAFNKHTMGMTSKVAGNAWKALSAESRELYKNEAKKNIDQKCKKCQKVFKKGNKLRYHEKTCSDVAIACNICGKEYSSRETLKRHFKSKHEEREDLKCSICSKEFFSQNNLRRHSLVHLDSKVVCDQCGNEYKNQNSLAFHKQKFHL